MVREYRPDDFDYDLPDELIAQEPAPARDASRLLVVDRRRGALDDAHFRDIVTHLRPGDLLVANQSKVIPARLFGHLSTGASVEVLLTSHAGGTRWNALTRPARKLRPGTRITFDEQLCSTVLESGEGGLRLIELDYSGDLDDHLDRLGKLPLPPYIKRYTRSPERYQTVYAGPPGSVAAPTAGLHFTPELLDQLRDGGIDVRFVTLHVGVGTFAPVRVERLADIRLHREHGHIPHDVVAAVERARRQGTRVVAVGTTTTRLLESVYLQHGCLRAGDASVDLFIRPPFEFHVVNALITNFHLPKSTLLMLVSAFSGHDLMRRAYAHAVSAGYRFYSFGDAMLLI